MRKKKKFNISLLAYVLCAIMIIIIIPCIADISGDVFRGKGRMSGYEEDSLYNDFIENNYEGLLEKTEYNTGIGKDIDKDTQDYYTFAIAYKKAVDYRVYVNNGENEKAEQVVKDIDNAQFNNVLFKEALENVKNFRSEIGVLYLNDFNEKVMNKIIREHGLEFIELFSCDTYVYLWSGHPLAKQEVISMEELDAYPCLSFDQGEHHSLYLAEEMKSTYDYKRLIKANDRATLLNLMIGLNAYTLCSGIICEELNGSDYMAIPLKETEKMRIGYVKRKGAKVSHIGEIYIEELKKYRENVM